MAELVREQEVQETIDRHELFALVGVELSGAYEKHGCEPWGRHEFYAICLEEMEEVWEAIKHDAGSHSLVAEMVQVVAMIARYCETGNRYGGGL